MVFNPSDGVSLTELIRLVRMHLKDFPQEMRDADHVGDDVTTKYRLYDQVYEADGVTATVAGVAAAVTMDYDSGWLTFTAAPATDAAIVITYSCVLHSDEQITEALNAAIDDCFGSFVVMGENATLVTTGAAELLCENSSGYDLDPEDIIERVEYWRDPHWVTVNDWRVKNHSGHKYIHFHRCPVAGLTIRISYLVRPGQLSVGTHTLEGTAGLPGRARTAIVLFACAKLVSAQLSGRTHSNLFHNAEGNNMSKVFDLRMRIQDLQAEGEMALRRARPRRVVGSF